MSSDARATNAETVDVAGPREVQPWARSHSGFLRAVLLILAYCSAVISMISMIAFRGVHTVSIVAGALCIAAVVAIFLLPRSRRPSG